MRALTRPSAARGRSGAQPSSSRLAIRSRASGSSGAQPPSSTLRLLVALLLSLATAGCFETTYLVQAGHGQREITLYARPIRDVLDDEDEPTRVRDLLRHVGPVKAFGERNGLRATTSYSKYTDLRRRAAVWVVSACAPLAFHPRTWRFPIAGEVPYLGWFSRADAERYAKTLRDAGWDADVRPSAAYSTLGWFEDPVLSTMLSSGPDAVGDLAETILHESLHATFYVPGQTGVNESVASFVGEELASRYLDWTFGAGSTEKAAYLATRKEGDRRAALLIRAHQDLSTLYESAASDDEKRAKKAERIAELSRALGATRPLNNASLYQWRSYHEGRKELAGLLASCGGDVARLVAALGRLKDVDLGPKNRADVGHVVELASCD